MHNLWHAFKYPKKRTDDQAKLPEHEEASTEDESDETSETELLIRPLITSDAACRLCSSLEECFNKSTNDTFRQDIIGVYQDLVSNKNCPTCCYLKSNAGYLTPPGLTPVIVEFGFTGWNIRIGSTTTTFLRTGSKIRGNKSVGVDVVDPHIDPRLIKKWINECDDCHLGMCHGMDNPWKKMDPAAQLMLIDVQKRCLVQQPGSCRYLALSYTWEKTMDPFQTTMGNLQELSQCGAFDLPSNRSRLTTTILDSMTLTKELGLTYLWVDRFCIIQDDHAQKHTQLRAMASIYVNAYFTIAACGDLRSEYGLLGIDTERPRLNPFLRIQLSPTCRIISRLPQDEACSKRQPRLGYHTRGWTFQEWALPSRVLAFHHHTVSWLCWGETREENGARSDQTVIMSRASTLLSRSPNINPYFGMVHSYSTRTLTYPEDAFEAFSSIIAAMGRSMDGGILYGLPEICFDSALLWTADTGDRRTDAAGNILKQFPSWSWLGWKGPIYTMYCSNIHRNDTGIYKNDNLEWTIRPVVTWSKMRISNSGSPDVAIKHTYYTNRLKFDLDSYHTAPYLDTQLRCYVPLAKHPVTQDNDCWSSVLKGCTFRLHVRIAKPMDFFLSRNGVPITNATQSIIGFLELPDRERSLLHFDSRYELICISRLDCPRSPDTMRLPEVAYLHRNCAGYSKGSCHEDDCLFGRDWIYECYNVLWIEWEDGIAYRKALGRVYREAWDDAETEEIDVRLG